MRKIYFVFSTFLLILGNHLIAQNTTFVEGNVYDNTKVYGIKNVLVFTKSNNKTYTDSLGSYKINVNTKDDSLFFLYKGKVTLGYDIATISAANKFDIALLINQQLKYKVLPEVVVTARNYKLDSLIFREKYAKIFNYQKGITTSMDGNGSSGFALEPIINMFRFKYNKNIKKFRTRLEEQEKERYIKYKWNKRTIKRITLLDDIYIDQFLKTYQPPYEWMQTAPLGNFYQYILNCSYEFRKNMMLPPIEQKLNLVK